MQPETSNDPLDVGTYIENAWANLLRQANIGETSLLTTARVSSLMLAQLCVDVEQTFRARLPLDLVFDSKTIEHLIANLKGINWPNDIEDHH